MDLQKINVWHADRVRRLFDCGFPLCLGGCCCLPGVVSGACAGCACWANASTTAATAGTCTAAVALGREAGWPSARDTRTVSDSGRST